jgi:hypothetical protein
MPRKKPKITHTVICDDIRQEIGNKHSFIGVYGPIILVSKIPYVFPKLSFVLYFEDVKGGDVFSVELKNPSGEQLGNTINGTAPEEIKGNIQFQIFAIFSPLNVKQEGEYKIEITCNDKWRYEINFVIKIPDKIK